MWFLLKMELLLLFLITDTKVYCLRKNKKTNVQPTVKNSTAEMAVNGRNPQVVPKQFTFGQSKRGRSFSKNCKPCHVNENKSNQPADTSSSSEMMDTLP